MYNWLIYVYIGNWIICGLWFWMQYLDIRTTLKNVTHGAIEANPAMRPYVKVGQPWLMVRGKLLNGAWVGLVCIFIPVLLPFVVYQAWSCWTNAVHVNEQVAGVLGKQGK